MIEPARQLAYKLAQAIEPRLNTILPPDRRAQASNEAIVIRELGTPWESIHSLADLPIEVGLGMILDAVQDEITEDQTEPWPPDPDGRHIFHSPQVELRSDGVYAWYGPKEDPVLALDPIPLSELGL